MSELEEYDAYDEAMDSINESFDPVKTRETYVLGPFNKYSGYKWRSLPIIMPKLPLRRRFVEVFGGSGMVTLNRRKSLIDVFNDRHAGVVAFFKVLRDHTLRDQLVAKVKGTLYSREDFITFKHAFYNLKDDDILERAYQWYCMVQMSYGGLARTFQRARNKADLNNLYEILPDLRIIAHRFGQTLVENLDWRTCLEDYDSEDTVFYLDPPYVDSNVYKLKMSRADHYELCERVAAMKGFVALSGFDNVIYRQFKWTEIHKWKIKGDADKTMWNREEALFIKD